MTLGRVIADGLRSELKIVGPTSSLEDIFEKEPVPLETFVTDAAYLRNPPLSPIQFEALRHLEQVYLPETYPLMVAEYGAIWKPVRHINFAWLQWGKGSGKDHVCRLAAARVAYLLLCLRSPQEYFGMPPQDEIQTLNVASSAPQAYRAFYKPLRKLADRSKCFSADTTDLSIRWGKGIESVSGHSDAETQEGLNLILGIADEISAFKTREESVQHAQRSGGREPTKTAESIITMMRTSARTRFPRNFKVAAISYPRYRGDAIQQLWQRGKDDNERNAGRSRVYVSGPYATWDVNPRVTSKSEFREDYDEDAEMSRAKYECDPPLGHNRFFRNDAAIYAAFAERRPDPVVVEYYWGKDERPPEVDRNLPEEQDGWQARFHFASDFIPIRGAAYCVHGDMAIDGDRAGVSMSHVRNWRRPQFSSPLDLDEGMMQPQPVVKNDFTFAFESDDSAQPMAREVQIRWYRKLVFELARRGFYVAKVTFDRFESADTIQILNSRGIEADRLSMDRDSAPWNALRDVMYDGRLEGYWRPTLVTELLALQRLGNGKLDHPPNGSKDEADALTGSVVTALEMGGDESDEPERSDEDAGDPFTVQGTFGLTTTELGPGIVDISPNPL